MTPGRPTTTSSGTDRTIETVQHIVLLRDGSTRLSRNVAGTNGIGRSGRQHIGTLVATNNFVNGIEVIDDIDDEGVNIRQINSRTQL